MKVLLTAAPLLLALFAAPAMAEAADAHAGHHPPAAEPAKPAASTESKGTDMAPGCPMMSAPMTPAMNGDATKPAGASQMGQMGQMGGGNMMGGSTMMGGSMMMGGDQHMHCMDATSAGSEPKTDEHEHSGSKDKH